MTPTYEPSPEGLPPNTAWDENHPCAHCGRPAWTHTSEGACEEESE